MIETIFCRAWHGLLVVPLTNRFVFIGHVLVVCMFACVSVFLIKLHLHVTVLQRGNNFIPMLSTDSRAYLWTTSAVRKVETVHGFFAAGGQTDEFLQLKGWLCRLPMFKNCGSFSIRWCGPLPHVKFSHTNSEIGTRRVNFSVPAKWLL